MTEPAPRRGVIQLSDPVNRFLRTGARSILIVAIVVFLAQWRLGRLPHVSDGGALTQQFLGPVQLTLLGIVGLGLIVSFRWLAPAAVLIAFSGSGMAVLSGFQYELPFPVFVFLAFLAPAVMLWLAWQGRETVAKIAVLAVSTGALLAGAWLGSAAIWNHYLGPTHPESTRVPLLDSFVEWVWVGAVDTDGFTVTARMSEPSTSLRLIVTDQSGREVARTEPATIPGDQLDTPVRVTVDDLEPATEYRYRFESEGIADEVRAGTVTTFPDGAASLRIAFGACARTGTNGVVFDAILGVDPDLYVITGDIHYRDIGKNDEDRFASAYDGVHESPARSALYRSVPIAYVWDDHDYGRNDSDSKSASRPAAWATYRTHVPHYDLPVGSDGSIQQAFTIGRVRVVMLDTRSHRLESDGTLLGSEQLEWLKAELLAARDTHALTVLVTPTAWIGAPEAGADHWGAFASERAGIGSFLADNAIDNVVLVGGDAHMVAIDDGSNSGYGGHDGFPVLQAAALDRRGSVKGGPYSHGTFPGGGQFGIVEVTDDGGDQIDVELIGLDWEGELLTSLETSFAVP